MREEREILILFDCLNLNYGFTILFYTILYYNDIIDIISMIYVRGVACLLFIGQGSCVFFVDHWAGVFVFSFFIYSSLFVCQVGI
jgi:hypothetical protein